MGIGDYVEDRISQGIAKGVDESMPKLQRTMDQGLDRTRVHVDELVTSVEKRTDQFLDKTQERLRAATAAFFDDLEKRWEKKLETETRTQFRLLNRVLVYTLIVAIFSFAYAYARVKLGW